MIRITRIALVFWAMMLFAGALIVRAGVLQLWQREYWASRAERQHVAAAKVPAPRGAIHDASGITLAESRQLVKLGIAPREVPDRRALSRALAKAGVAQRWIARATDVERVWVELPGRHLATEVAAITAMRGVYAEPTFERIYTPSAGLRRLIGRASGERGVEGLELGLDSILRGTPGLSPRVVDARGRSIESPETSARAIAARPGHSVVLTLNYHLQEIVDRALADAVVTMGASGGDIVVVDPHSGAVLAMASRRTGPAAAATALTEPFEPGSTLKPLHAATLLSLGRARPDEVIDTRGGVYEMEHRTITDLHREDRLSLSDVIRWSSNVGMVRFTERLTPDEQYLALRDFGFGTITGSPYPSEAAGTLRPPRSWSRVSASSLAMGYEIAVTPIQLAMAYASIANGGALLDPAFIREIRSPDGAVVYRHRRRVVRRVMDEAVAQQVRAMLVDVVERGTAAEADLRTFLVGGKTGTTRTALVGQRGYAQRQYFATFVGLFPADAPQYVVLVKIDRPAAYFGGATAAPVSKTILEAALAARDAALDRRSLAEEASTHATTAAVTHESTAVASPASRSAARATAAGSIAAEASIGGDASGRGDEASDSSGSVPVVVSLTAGGDAFPVAPPRKRAVPDVRGLALRDAVHTLHRAGFKVELTAGVVGLTRPAAGTLAAPGAVVRLQRGGDR